MPPGEGILSIALLQQECGLEWQRRDELSSGIAEAKNKAVLVCVCVCGALEGGGSS